MSRSARPAQELIGWTDRFVRDARWRDTEWRAPPDQRGEETLNLITNGNFGAVSHQGRAFVGLSVFYRYAGLSEQNEPPALIRDLLPPAMLERARLLGAAFRVAHLISA